MIPVIIVVFLCVFLIGLILLKYTVYGRNLYAIGGNAEASRMFQVVRNKTFTFVICAVLSALAGVLMVGRIGSGQVTAGEGLQMQPIAAAVLNNASLLGVLIMGVQVNGFNIMGAGSEI